MADQGLKRARVGVVATLIFFRTGNVSASERDVSPLPSRTNPLQVDRLNKRALIYRLLQP